MSDPLVTVGITAFNAEGSIEKALQSALAQDWRPLEILVVDDCSSDGTVQRVEAMAKSHPEIRLVRHDRNLGVAGARNTLIGEAAGIFLAFFDDDDESTPDRITRQVRRIVAYEEGLSAPALVICHSAREQVYPQGFRRIEPTMGMDPLAPAPAGPAVAWRILRGDPLPGAYGSCATCSQMARLSTYKLAGGFDPAFRRNEDTDLAVRLGLLGAHFVGVAEPLVRQTMQVTSDKPLDGELTYTLALLRKHRDQFTNAAACDFAQEWIRAKHDWIGGRRWRFVRRFTFLAIRHPLSVARRVVYALPAQGSRASLKKLHR